MTRMERIAGFIALTIVIMLALAMAFGREAKAQPNPADCPPGFAKCKVITLTEQEEQTLLGQDMIFEQARWARQQFGPLLDAWKKKLEQAPAGNVPKAEEPKK